MKKVLIIIISVFLILLFGYFSVSFKLLGESSIVLDVNEDEYEESGYEAKIFNINLNDKVKIIGNVDINKIGKYSLTYKFLNKKIKRVVEVVDSENPKIELKGDTKVVLYQGEKYEELGYEVSDNYDTNFNVEIENNVDSDKVGQYEIIYKVKDSSGNESSVVRTVEVKEKKVIINDNVTYIKGILIVNKNYSLPSSYGGENSIANEALKKLQNAANKEGYSLPLISGYRSYSTQNSIYNSYIKRWGQEYTDTVSARPGHSEHQTGLAFDVGQLSSSFGDTEEGVWLKENCYKYGFIIRYLKGKEKITGYSYEPWHIRYVGVDVATEIMQKNITLEEYLGIA